MRAFLVIALLSLAGLVRGAEPVMMDKSLLVGGDIPKQYRPDYPAEARRSHIEGAGVFILHLDSKTGEVTSITVQKSTGHKILDTAVLTACIHWRFKPNTVRDVRVPMAFSMRRPM